MRYTKIQLLAFVMLLCSQALFAQVSGNAFFVKMEGHFPEKYFEGYSGVDVQDMGSNKYLVCIGNNEPNYIYSKLTLLENAEYISVFTVKGKKIAAETGRIIIKLNNAGDVTGIASACRSLGLSGFKPLPLLTNTYIAQNSMQGNSNIDVCKALLATGLCKYAEPEMVFSPIVGSTPNDPLFNRQWSLLNTGSSQQSSGTPGADMKVTQAWDVTMGSNIIQVAIIDSGVDTLHPDLMPNLLRGFDAGNDTDVTHGYPTPNYDEDGHGTCCAGIACAVANNDMGTAGVAPNCQIIPIRLFFYLNFNGTIIPFSTTVYAANAMSWAWQNGADIMSNSWGLPDSLLPFFGDPQVVYDAIQDAHTLGRSGVGCIQLYSTGNDDLDSVLLPGRLPEVMGVGATSMCDERKSPTSCDPEHWWGGNYGNSLDISAPGVRIPAPDMLGANGFVSGSYYTTFNGTSAACPNAAGVVALILSVNPHLTGVQARYILESTADRTGGYQYNIVRESGSWSYELGYGRVNALTAVQAAWTTVGFNDDEAKSFGAYVAYDNAGLPYLNLHTEKAENIAIEVYDMAGRKVQGQSIYTNNLNNMPLNITTTGMYLVRVIVGNEVMALKAIVR